MAHTKTKLALKSSGKLNADNALVQGFQDLGLLDCTSDSDIVFEAQQAHQFVQEWSKADFHKALEAGRSFLLFDVDQSAGDQLFSHLGLQLPGSYVGLAIRGQRNATGKLDIALDGLRTQAYDSSTARVESRQYEGVLPEILDENGAASSMQSPANEAEYFMKSLAAPLTASKIGGNDSPPTKNWRFTETYQWNTKEEKVGFLGTNKIKGQKTYVQVTYTVTVMLDQNSLEDFQWVVLEVKGYQSVGASGMVEDNSLERGWANAIMNVNVSPLSDFLFYENSPTNTNNQTTYDTSVGFEVGVSKDGPSGTFNFSRSISNTISDWAIKLNDLNNWSFYQADPFDARDRSFFDHVNFITGVPKLPNLSTGVMDFVTMTVWRNEAVSKRTATINLNMKGTFGYLAAYPIPLTPLFEISNYTQDFQKSVALSFDLSEVS